MDARLGCLSVHLDTPQCFSAEIYAVDLNVSGAQEDLKVCTATYIMLLVTFVFTLQSLQYYWYNGAVSVLKFVGKILTYSDEFFILVAEKYHGHIHRVFFLSKSDCYYLHKRELRAPGCLFLLLLPAVEWSEIPTRPNSSSELCSLNCAD